VLAFVGSLLRNQKMQPIETLYYISPICILWMVPAAVLTELPTAYRANSMALVMANPLMFLASGAAGAGVNFTSFLLVKRLSAMTLKTLTMARNGGLVIVSAVLMGETITKLESIGYTGLLVCFAMYTVVSYTEKERLRSEQIGPIPEGTELNKLVTPHSADSLSDDESAPARHQGPRV
jgi:hypothetical protein